MGLLLVLGLILLVFWVLGLTVFSLGNLVYIALVIAVILIIVWLVKAVFRRS
jgi:low affinity Fe/Cu permease